MKKPGGSSDGLRSSDIDPRFIFHYGFPSGSNKFAYDPVQKILAIATKDGRIKLYGKDNSQVLLESKEAVPSKFLQFLENEGILLNVISTNHIEVWDIDKKLLSHVHVCKREITSFTVMQRSSFMYVGDSAGNISVLELDRESCNIVQMNYSIPLSASHGTEVSSDAAVMHILPQPTAESRRILIIFRDGLISLWDIRESKSIFTTGGNVLQPLYHETKQVTSACWACPIGSKVAVGYNNGEIFVWAVPSTPNLKTELSSDCGTQSAPICKLNLGYKLEKIPISSLKWVYADGKASRLYTMGASDLVSVNLLQVILLNEHSESRTIKLALPLSEPCIDMEIVSSSNEQGKQKQDSFLLLGKSGHVYAYDDCQIERYLLQYQSRSPPSLPKEVMLKMPFLDSSITVTKFITDNSYMLSSADEGYALLAKSVPSLLALDTKPKDVSQSHSNLFSGFTKAKNLFITGHSDGAINFWDTSCPFFIPILSIKQQSEKDFSLSGIPLTALYFDDNSRVLVSGDQSGMVRIFKLKYEPQAENIFLSFSGNKKGNSQIVQTVKVIKVNGSVISLNMKKTSQHLAVGSDQGYVYLVDIEGPTVLYQKHIASEISSGIVSLQFETCSFHGFEKNVLVVATKDSSVLALDSDAGNTLSTNAVHPKKPSKALFMQILDGANISNISDVSKESPAENLIPKQWFVLLCSEKAAYVYSSSHAVQGVKKVLYKKKFHSSSCCWASTFYSGSDVGLILLFANGKIEIRSLPELSLLKETCIRGFTYSTPKPNSLSDTLICSSRDGDVVMVNGDQEIYFVSVLLQKDFFRLLDSIKQVYRNDLTLPQEGFVSGPIVQKDKKKGIFGSVLKGSKTKHVPEVETEDTKESMDELSTIFSTVNFSCVSENEEDQDELNIDDIDLDDIEVKSKEQSRLPTMNTQKLASKLQAFKGKWKQMKVKNEKNNIKEEQQDDKNREKNKIKKEQEDDKNSAVDQIKKKYGFSMSGESSVAKVAESKLHENLKKLQGINLRTTEMQDTARSFSSMAKDVLRIAEHDKRNL
ncbi:Transducin/WD40 repeat protein [Melia azedarach]|uniref:Transducin/WD40 repeat protein n=1 Tax=Melia azedarach TaxID=155640 RepID=A0ACC1XS20_MELAZ|nr:Transducin/WD40 repeat protein [Melia azedarach]